MADAATAQPPPSADLPRPLRVGGGFRNPGHHDDRSWLDVLRWKLAGTAARWPRRVALEPRPAPAAPAQGIAVTAVGHATFLLQTPTQALLTDPVWSERVGPIRGVGPVRAEPPGIVFESLPPLDAILLSHDHYDHCDLATLRRLARAHPRAVLVTPLAFADLARRAGFAPERHRELDWWQTTALPASAPPPSGLPTPSSPLPAPGSELLAPSSQLLAPSSALPAPSPLLLTATPARHWSNRLSGKRNQRLWCGWHIAASEGSVLFTGDTAYDAKFFPAIRRHLGAPDLALIPIGAYAPRWFMREQHCDPEEAVQIHLALGARRSLGMHWGVFPFTDEPRDQPPALLAEAALAAGLAPDVFVAARTGATVLV